MQDKKAYTKTVFLSWNSMFPAKILEAGHAQLLMLRDLLWAIELPWRHAYLFCKKNPSAMPFFDPPRLLIFLECM